MMENLTEKKVLPVERTNIINAVNSPLGFFTLAVLIIEGLISILVYKTENAYSFYILLVMLSLLFMLIGIVAFIAYKKPEVLNYNTPKPVKENDRTEQGTAHEQETLLYNSNKLGLKGIYRHKREEKAKQLMKELFYEAIETVNKGGDSIIRLCSVNSKQFLHPDGDFYSDLIHFLDCLQKNEKYDSSRLRIIQMNPFSKLAFFRAESEEFKSSSETLHPDKYVKATWDGLLFKDALISFCQAKALAQKYPKHIAFRFSDFMPIFMLASQTQSFIGPATFCASKRTYGDWHGKMPVYHHVGLLDFRSEAVNHFDYLFAKGTSMDEFINRLNHKVFLNNLHEENEHAVLKMISLFLEECKNENT